MKTHVSLFTGIGGFDLACDWLGIDTVLQAECDPYCLKVLEKHWPNVRRIHDVREVNALAYTEARENHRRNRGELAEAQGRGRSGNTAVDVGGQDSPFILTGGFPCQPFSCAGKRKGREDDRHLWPEMLRVIQELKPLYVVAENVRGLLSIERGLVFEHCLADLEAAGYEVWPLVIPACAVNAPHRRDRVWIVAHAHSDRARERHDGNAERCQLGTLRGGRDCADSQDTSTDADKCGNAANGNGAGLAFGDRGTIAEKSCTATDKRDWWSVEPNVGRVAHGVSARVDRLKCLGNAVVPQVAYEIIRAIVEADRA